MSGKREIRHVAADASKFQRSNHSSLDSLTQKVRNELNACGDVFSLFLSFLRVTFSPLYVRSLIPPSLSTLLLSRSLPLSHSRPATDTQ